VTGLSQAELSKCFEDLKESLGRAVVESIVEEIEVLYSILLV
jgi:hypothetical protein